MRTIEVEFTEADKSKLLNEICNVAEKDSRCYTEKYGWTLIFENILGSGLMIFATVLINDDFNGKKPSRHPSTNIKLLQNGVEVKSNLNYEFEDSINKELIQEFHKKY